MTLVNLLTTMSSSMHAAMGEYWQCIKGYSVSADGRQVISINGQELFVEDFGTDTLNVEEELRRTNQLQKTVSEIIALSSRCFSMNQETEIITNHFLVDRAKIVRNAAQRIVAFTAIRYIKSEELLYFTATAVDPDYRKSGLATRLTSLYMYTFNPKLVAVRTQSKAVEKIFKNIFNKISPSYLGIPEKYKSAATEILSRQGCLDEKVQGAIQSGEPVVIRGCYSNKVSDDLIEMPHGVDELKDNDAVLLFAESRLFHRVAFWIANILTWFRNRF